MATDPNQMAQMIALYKQMFPGGPAQAQAYQSAQAPMQIAAGMGGAAPGSNTAAGGTNALAKLLMALMTRKRMQDYQKQFPQQATTASGSPPVSTPSPAGSGTGGMTLDGTSAGAVPF